MAIKLSERVNAIKSSPTLVLTARAAQLRAEGKDIIGLGAGEPDFDTPEHIKQAAIRALHDGFTKYTPVGGTPSLKQAVVNKFQKENDLGYQTNQILVSCGGKQSFYNLTQALINPGDEVIIPSPYWVSYPDIVLLAGGTPIIISADQSQHYKISPNQLRQAITPQTRLFVINSPSNPTGKAYSADELRALGEVLLDFPHVMVATDDMYEHILWQPNSFVNVLNVTPELYDRTFVLNGVSKAYSMTGWRIGYAAGPANVIAAMTKIQSQSTSNPTSISQVAAQEALAGDQTCIDIMLAAFKERHDYVLGELNKIPGIECLPSDGTFYVFPNIAKVIARFDGINSDLELSEHLIEKAGVAIVPGSAFGCENHFRISIATSMENLQAAIERLKKALAV